MIEMQIDRCRERGGEAFGDLTVVCAQESVGTVEERDRRSETGEDVQLMSLDDAGYPIHMKVAKVETFCIVAIADWAQESLARGCEVSSDGLACFRAVTEVG